MIYIDHLAMELRGHDTEYKGNLVEKPPWKHPFGKTEKKITFKIQL
jgi:hypothetical protein